MDASYVVQCSSFVLQAEGFRGEPRSILGDGKRADESAHDKSLAMGLDEGRR